LTRIPEKYNIWTSARFSRNIRQPRVGCGKSHGRADQESCDSPAQRVLIPIGGNKREDEEMSNTITVSKSNARLTLSAGIGALIGLLLGWVIFSHPAIGLHGRFGNSARV
jgi:hypothetical protein